MTLHWCVTSRELFVDFITFQVSSARRVTEMGTYVTQSAFSVGSDKKGTSSGDKIKRPPLRQFFMNGDFALAGSLATALTKQALRFWASCPDPRKQNVSGALVRTSACCSLRFSSVVRGPVHADTVQCVAPRQVRPPRQSDHRRRCGSTRIVSEGLFSPSAS